MRNALEATLRGIQSPVREKTRPKPAEERTTKKKAPVVNMSFYRQMWDTGKEPPFRKRKRTPAELHNDSYVDSLKEKIEREEIETRRDDDISFVEDMAKKFGVKIEDKGEERRRMIRKWNDEATIPPQIEFNINGQ